MSENNLLQRIESKGHKLKRLDSGEIDDFAVSEEFHNGVKCILCGDCWCVHCEHKNISECVGVSNE